ncbi:MAG: hypothetical protein KME31_29215 [Tolypothrix carrinoi HA7290-LM1]|nr:hypothetical protein [Tolypothrix carrinoi HA7290-LM1]
MPKLKDELAQDPDNPMRKYRVVFKGGQRSLVGGGQDIQCPARHRDLGGRTLGAAESEMSDMPIEFGVAFSDSEAVRFPA